MINPSPSNFALSSKRWRAGLGGMLLMVLVSMPWTGIAPDVAEQLREFFAAIVISFIAGQTVTDVVTKGRTSGSFSPGKPAAPTVPPPAPLQRSAFSCRVTIGTYPISRPAGGVTNSAESRATNSPAVGGGM